MSFLKKILIFRLETSVRNQSPVIEHRNHFTIKILQRLSNEGDIYHEETNQHK